MPPSIEKLIVYFLYLLGTICFVGLGFYFIPMPFSILTALIVLFFSGFFLLRELSYFQGLGKCKRK